MWWAGACELTFHFDDTLSRLRSAFPPAHHGLTQAGPTLRESSVKSTTIVSGQVPGADLSDLVSHVVRRRRLARCGGGDAAMVKAGKELTFALTAVGKCAGCHSHSRARNRSACRQSGNTRQATLKNNSAVALLPARESRVGGHTRCVWPSISRILGLDRQAGHMPWTLEGRIGQLVSYEEAPPPIQRLIVHVEPAVAGRSVRGQLD